MLRKCANIWLMIAYIALLSALLNTHCARMWFYMSDSLFIARFLNIHRSGVLKHWHGLCHMKLQPSRRKFSVHHTTMLHVTSCKANISTCRVHFRCSIKSFLQLYFSASKKKCANISTCRVHFGCSVKSFLQLYFSASKKSVLIFPPAGFILVVLSRVFCNYIFLLRKKVC